MGTQKKRFFTEAYSVVEALLNLSESDRACQPSRPRTLRKSAHAANMARGCEDCQMFPDKSRCLSYRLNAER